MGVYICVCICVHTHGCQVEATVMIKTLLDYKALHAFHNYIYIYIYIYIYVHPSTV